MTTDNLGLPTVTANQNNKEVTINDGINGLDKACMGQSSFAITTHRTLTTDEFKGCYVINLTGTPVADFNLIVPDSIKKVFAVRNGTGKQCTVKRSTGATVTIGSTTTIFISDGTDIVQLASDPGTTAQPYDLPLYFPGVFVANQVLMRFQFSRNVTFPSGLTNSQASSRVAATASTTLTIKKNGSSIGTLVWAAAGSTPTVTFSSSQSFVPGNILTVEAPAVADLTLADISLTMAGTR